MGPVAKYSCSHYSWGVEILRTISMYVEDKDLPFLLIGGHAANVYGISRQTGDLDLLVQRSKKAVWDGLLVKLRYEKGPADSNFARYRPDSIAAWPIDLMFVDDETFRRMHEDARLFDVGAARVRVVSVRHLMALKIHALKHFQEHRFGKDYNDVLLLLRHAAKDMSNEDLREFCLKYADIGLYEKLRADLGR